MDDDELILPPLKQGETYVGIPTDEWERITELAKKVKAHRLPHTTGYVAVDSIYLDELLRAILSDE